MGEFLTTMQAAKRAKTSRPTISRALKSGELAGVRGNDQKWMIDTDSLAAWAKERAPVQNEQRSHTVQEQRLNALNEQVNALSADLEKMRTDLATSREALARYEGENTANRERITDLTEQRERLLQMLEARPATAAQGFWVRLFNRNG